MHRIYTEETGGVVAWRQASTPIVISKVATDGIAPGDSATTIAVRPVSANDAASIGDSGTSRMTFASSAADAASLGSTGLSSPGGGKTASDPVLLGATGTTQVIFATSASDGASPSDSSAVQTAAAAATDAIVLGDSAVRAGPFGVWAIDSWTLGDSVKVKGGRKGGKLATEQLIEYLLAVPGLADVPVVLNAADERTPMPYVVIRPASREVRDTLEGDLSGERVSFTLEVWATSVAQSEQLADVVDVALALPASDHDVLARESGFEPTTEMNVTLMTVDRWL